MKTWHCKHKEMCIRPKSTTLLLIVMFLRANDPGKDNIVMIIEKNTTPKEDEFYEYPYYILRIQRRFIMTKRQWFRAQYPHHRFIIEKLDNANSTIHLTSLKRKVMKNVFSVILGLLILHVMPCMPWPRLPFTTNNNWPQDDIILKPTLRFSWP